ncbi:hypothetical protein F4802DRAFT_231055 [Xylaria palmicola]|nr:hypothetical protein F4802DRAFT_231055 [Xylaria palmicola]
MPSQHSVSGLHSNITILDGQPLAPRESHPSCLPILVSPPSRLEGTCIAFCICSALIPPRAGRGSPAAVIPITHSLLAFELAHTMCDFTKNYYIYTSCLDPGTHFFRTSMDGSRKTACPRGPHERYIVQPGQCPLCG